MKFFLKLLLSLFLIVLMLGAIGFAIYRATVRSNKEAEVYVRETIPLVFSEWNVLEFYDRTSPEFKNAMTLDKVYGIFNQGRTLGRMEKWAAPQGTASGFAFVNKAPRAWANFTTKVEFERGEAEIRLGLVRNGDRWQIQSFNVQSPDVGRLVQNTAASSPPQTQPVTQQPVTQQPLPPSLPQFATAEEAQREAVRRYPALGVSGSSLNQEFVARTKRYRKENPEYFRDSSWPLRLAEEAVGAIKSR